jgi:hypothetical protein
MEAVLADETAAHTAHAALTGALAVFTGVAVPDVRVAHGRNNTTVQGSQIDAEKQQNNDKLKEKNQFDGGAK